MVPESHSFFAPMNVNKCDEIFQALEDWTIRVTPGLNSPLIGSVVVKAPSRLPTAPSDLAHPDGVVNLDFDNHVKPLVDAFELPDGPPELPIQARARQAGPIRINYATWPLLLKVVRVVALEDPELVFEMFDLPVLKVV